MDEDLDALRERKKRALAQEQGLGAPASPVYVDGSQNFDQTVAAHEVVLVHYYADGGTGQRLHPVVESVARETLAAVAKVNVVHHQKLALERGVEATPAFEVYADGECRERVRGQVEKDELVELVGEYTAF
jgi:thioredoxin 1